MTAVLQTAIVWGIEFMHSSNAIIGFLGVSFFLAVTIRESREDMPERPKKLIAGVSVGDGYFGCCHLFIDSFQLYSVRVEGGVYSNQPIIPHLAQYSRHRQ